MTSSRDRYGPDVLATDWRRPRLGRTAEVDAELDLVVEDVETGFCGAVVGWDKQYVTLEDRHGAKRTFPLGPGFHLDGRPIALRRPRGAPGSAAAGRATDRNGGGTASGLERGGAAPGRTASGSIAVPNARARVARASRIYVEGRHDAELVEQIWGDDLRIEGVVVEYLGGVDDLPAVVREFAPGPGRRLGVLVDHLVPGSKESRIANEVERGPHSSYVKVVGHPFVDIWQAVKPSVLGFTAWPEIPPGRPWKESVIEAVGWSLAVPDAWRRIRSAVRTFADLEPALLGRVEELIDFVTGD